ncbi:MAG: glycosyltransferase family 39 protein [Chloroflexota bacterium]
MVTTSPSLAQAPASVEAARREPAARSGPPAHDIRALALVALLAAVAAAIRFVDLWSIPIFTDEGDEIGLALRIVRDGARPLTNDDPYLGPLFNYLLAGAFWVAGPSPWLPRLLMLLLGTLTVVLTYLLARELTLALGGDWRRATTGGAIAAVLLAVNPTHVVVISHVAWGSCLTSCLTTAAAWLFVGATRRAEAGRPAALGTGLRLVLAAGALGLAFQTHPMVAAFVPPVGLYVLWRVRRWLLTPWPYFAAGVFVLAQLPTLLFIGQNGLGRWLAAIREKQTLYAGDSSLSVGLLASRLVTLLHALGAELGGLLTDRDIPFPPLWHPAVLLGLAVAVGVLVWLWRRDRPLVGLMVLGNVLLLPVVNGTYTPLISSGRYLIPTTILLLAGLGSWTALALPSGRMLSWQSWRRPAAPNDVTIDGQPSRPSRQTIWPLAPVAGALALGAVAAISLVWFSVAAHRDERTNDRLLASLAALEASYRPGEVVTIDRAMYRDWTLTEGRLQRVFESWLETRGIPYRVLDLDDGGRLRRDLADRGGLAVLARRTVQPVSVAYDLDEIAGGAAPSGPPGTGYSIVRVRLRAALLPPTAAI